MDSNPLESVAQVVRPGDRQAVAELHQQLCRELGIPPQGSKGQAIHLALRQCWVAGTAHAAEQMSAQLAEHGFRFTVEHDAEAAASANGSPC
jgi:hypothetical protein